MPKIYCKKLCLKQKNTLLAFIISFAKFLQESASSRVVLGSIKTSKNYLDYITLTLVTEFSEALVHFCLSYSVPQKSVTSYYIL